MAPIAPQVTVGCRDYDEPGIDPKNIFQELVGPEQVLYHIGADDEIHARGSGAAEVAIRPLPVGIPAVQDRA